MQAHRVAPPLGRIRFLRGQFLSVSDGILTVKLEKFERLDEYITNAKPYIRDTRKDSINAIVAHALTCQ